MLNIPFFSEKRLRSFGRFERKQKAFFVKNIAEIQNRHAFSFSVFSHGFLRCGGFFINQPVIDMGFSGLYGFCRALVNGDELDPLHAPLAGRFGNLPMGFQTAGKVIGIRRIITDGLCLFLKTGNRFGERFLFVLVFFRQVDTDLFGKLAKNLVLINRAGQPVRLGRSACGLRQLSFFGVCFGSVLLFAPIEEFRSCPLFIGKDKAHLGTDMGKHKLAQNLDL